MCRFRARPRRRPLRRSPPQGPSAPRWPLPAAAAPWDGDGSADSVPAVPRVAMLLREGVVAVAVALGDSGLPLPSNVKWSEVPPTTLVVTTGPLSRSRPAKPLPLTALLLRSVPTCDPSRDTARDVCADDGNDSCARASAAPRDVGRTALRSSPVPLPLPPVSSNAFAGNGEGRVAPLADMAPRSSGAACAQAQVQRCSPRARRAHDTKRDGTLTIYIVSTRASGLAQAAPPLPGRTCLHQRLRLICARQCRPGDSACPEDRPRIHAGGGGPPAATNASVTTKQPPHWPAPTVARCETEAAP